MLRSSRLALAILLCLAPVPAFAGATTCLTGTAPEVSGDDADIRDARAIIDAACPCADYDGTGGNERGDYLACVKTAFDLPGVDLRKPCEGTVKKIYKASNCGRSSVLGARPCIYESTVNGKLTCKIRYTNKADGTPNDKCVSNTKYTAVPCDLHDFCLDAADTNDDLRIAAPGDDGQCLPLAPEGEIFCQELASGACSSTPGTSGTVVVGDVLTPEAIYRGGQVLFDDTGVIVHVGCASSCTGPCAALLSTATTVTCPDGAISPGLVNAHDHLTFAHNSPHSDTGERYEHRHEWRLGINGHTEISTLGSGTADQVRYGELRHLMAGTTSIVGHGGQVGLLRNLDSANQEGFGQTPAGTETFPLDDSSGIQQTSGCAYGAGIVTTGEIASLDAYLPHVAEGIDAAAQNEYTCLSQAPNDVVEAKTAITGGLALSVAQMTQSASEGAKLIWSPRSNISLYGNTAEAQVMNRFGITIALGTDWMPTGSMNMLRELRCAASFDDAYLGNAFTDRELWMMATQNAAALSGFSSVAPLAAGNAADIAVFDQAAGDGYAAVLNADPEDVLLVLRGGKTLYGQSPLAATLNGGICEVADVCGSDKDICIEDEIATSYSTLLASVGSIYPLWFCGDPTGEPTCVPSRSVSVSGSSTYDGTPVAGDADGDGVADAGDNCPGVFNPIRPLDGGAQGDADADDEGDACDPCPLDADTTDCTFDPNDADSDGFANAADNCPYVSNPDQADADADDKGDVCDACPMDANPGTAQCPELAGMSPASGNYVRLGTNGPTFPTAVTVQMSTTVATDTFIPITSSNESALLVTDGGVTVLAGQSSAVVLLEPVSVPGSPVTLEATFGPDAFTADVRVLDTAEAPLALELTPETATLAPGGTIELTVTLDIPAPPGGELVTLSVDPPGAGSVPVSVIVPTNELSVTFDYDDGSTVSEITVTATGSQPSATDSSVLTAVMPGGTGLILNEIDYDQVGTDDFEFIEIYNPTVSNVSLQDVSVFLVNGASSSSYAEYDLSPAGYLPPGGYVLLAATTVVPPMGVERIDLASGTFQNGAPDGVAVLYTVTSTLLDAISYEGAITSATVGSHGVFDLVEDMPPAAADSNVTDGSIARLPNGVDTHSDVSDWAFTTTVTPGLANVP